ncbi:14133_t:CDS:1, partial [Cetraspora pellucida]
TFVRRIHGGNIPSITLTSNNTAYNDINIFDTKMMKWPTLNLFNIPFKDTCIFYSAISKDNLILYIGGIGGLHERGIYNLQ